MTGPKNPEQSAIGSGIVQVIGDKSSATLTTIEQAPPRPVTATAPAAPASFLGRRDVLDELRDHFESDPSLALALHGMEGVGKTVTARKLVAAMVETNRFPGGVFWADLSTNNGNVLPILRTWGRICAQELATESDLDVLTNLVRGLLTARIAEDGRLLVVMDDIRPEWLEATQRLQSVIPPDTPLLITTWDKRVARALNTQIVSLEPMGEAQSLELLETHAGSSIPPEDLGTVEKLLALVGFLPLAIELAGKHIRERYEKPGFTLDSFYRRVHDRVMSSLDLPGHRGLAATCDVTYKTLSAEVQRVFRWLGAFSSNQIHLSDLSQVLELDEEALSEMLDAMVARSMLEWGKDEGEYAIHALLHQYAGYLLRRTDEEPVARRRHLTHFLTFTEPPQCFRYDEVESRWEEISHSLQWTKATQDWLSYLVAVEGITHVRLGVLGFLDARGYWGEARELLRDAFNYPDLEEDQLLEATLTFKRGAFAFLQAEIEQAKEFLEQSWELLGKLPDSDDVPLRQAYVCEFLARLMMQQDPEIALEWSRRGNELLANIDEPEIRGEKGYLKVQHGAILAQTGEWKQAVQVLEEGIALLADRPSSALVSGYINLGNVHAIRGDSEKAVASWQSGIETAEHVGDQRRQADLWQNIAITESWADRLQQSIAYNQKALETYQRIGDIQGTCRIHVNIAEDYTKLGEHSHALDHLQQALKEARLLHLQRQEMFALTNLAWLYFYDDKQDQAGELVDRADELCRQLDIEQWRSEIFQLQAYLAAWRGEYEEALSFAETAVETAVNEREKGKALRVRGDVLLTSGNESEAEADFLDSISTLKGESRYELAKSQLTLGELYLKQKKKRQAYTNLTQARSTLQEIGASRDIVFIDNLLS